MAFNKYKSRCLDIIIVNESRRAVKINRYMNYRVIDTMRPHRMHSMRMRPIAINKVASSVCVYVSVGHDHEPLKNGEPLRV